MNKVEALCSGCANFDPSDGGCKLAWVTRKNQTERADAKFCEDAEVLTGDASTRSAPAILVPESWLTLKNK